MHTLKREQAISLLRWNPGSWNFFRSGNTDQMDLKAASLRGVDLRKSNLNGLDLGEADLREANLSGVTATVHLRGANLADANLEGAGLAHLNLAETNLAGTNLVQADLRFCHLAGITNWREIAALRGANIFGCQNAPKEFRAWALAQGAVEFSSDQDWQEALDGARKSARQSICSVA